MSMLVNSFYHGYTFFCLFVFICVITFLIFLGCYTTNHNLVYLYRELRELKELKDILERLEYKHNTMVSSLDTMVSSLEKNNDIINLVRETNQINARILKEIEDEKRKYRAF